MTPAKTIDILRQLHDWLRGGTQWAPTMGAEAVETAIEMIERLEAAEKERDDVAQQLVQSEQGKRNISEECDELRAAVRHEADCVDAAKAEIEAMRAKVERMEQQEPSHWGCTVLQSDGRWKEEVSREAPPEGYFSIRDIFPLYALPCAKGEEK